MHTAIRHKNNTIISQLENSPKKFDFIQAVKLIECEYIHNYKNGNINIYDIFSINTPAYLESIRFSAVNRLVFQETDISSISKLKTKGNKWNISVSFMGLTGPSGVLPYHYSEQVNESNKNKDYTLNAFYNFFNHRTITLFYQASVKYNYPVEFERHNRQIEDCNDLFSQAILSLCGIGIKSLRNIMSLSDLAVAYYSGLFSHTVKSKTGLTSILKDYFKMNIEVREFTGGWYNLIEDSLTRLPDRFNKQGNNSNLGVSTFLGSSARIPQSKFDIVIGPVPYDQMDKYSPGSKNIRQLIDLTTLYIGPELKYDILLKVIFTEKPKPATLSKNSDSKLGWNTWLSAATTQNKPIQKEHILSIQKT